MCCQNTRKRNLKSLGSIYKSVREDLETRLSKAADSEEEEYVRTKENSNISPEEHSRKSLNLKDKIKEKAMIWMTNIIPDYTMKAIPLQHSYQDANSFHPSHNQSLQIKVH
jgi:hypothetical protein